MYSNLPAGLRRGLVLLLLHLPAGYEDHDTSSSGKKKQIKPRSTTCLIVKTHVCSLYYGIFGSVLCLQNFIRSYYASDDDHFCYGKLSKMTKTKPAPVGSWLLVSPATTLD